MTCNNSTLTQKRLKEVLHYNPDSGIFTWKVNKNRDRKGRIAGSLKPNGRNIIKLDSVCHLTHRLAFLYMTGSFPKNDVDHINRAPNDNRWENLRNATRRENSENKSNNAIFIGVTRTGGKWRAHAASKGKKKKYLGMYVTHLAACYARWAYDLSIRGL